MEEKTTKKDQTHKKHYRGWLPKEPKPLQPQSNQKTTTTISTKTTGGLATGTLILGFLLLAGPYYLFPELYVPKTNPSWGYTTANSIAGWTFTAGGIGLMLLSIILFTLYAVKLGEKNPAWMNHNWITPRYTNTFGKKIYISTIAINSLMIATFLAITILTPGTTTPVIITFTVLMNIVNLSIGIYYYENYKRTQKNKVQKTNKKRTNKIIRGWLPKSPNNITHAHKPPKPRWKRPVWIAATLIATVALAFFAYRGAEALNHYTNPKADVTAAYFEKNTNGSTSKIGDVIEVQVWVYWHGHVLPEFMRQVKIVDTYAENNYQLIGGNNTLQYSGYGGNKQFEYLLKVVDNNTESVELTKPRLYLDNTEIPLYNQSQNFES